MKQKTTTATTLKLRVGISRRDQGSRDSQTSCWGMPTFQRTWKNVTKVRHFKKKTCVAYGRGESDSKLILNINAVLGSVLRQVLLLAKDGKREEGKCQETLKTFGRPANAQT